MKAFAHKILLILSLAALLCLGIDWILETTDIGSVMLYMLDRATFGLVGTKDAVSWPGMRDATGGWLRIAIGTAAVLLPILTAASGLLVWRDSSIRARTADGGVIRLAPGAVERIVRRDVRANVEEVLSVGVYARQGKRSAPAVTIHVGVTDRSPVPTVEAAVRREAERVLRHLMGVADTKQITVVVHDVSGGAARPKRAPSPEGRRQGNGKRRRPAADAQAALPSETV